MPYTSGFNDDLGERMFTSGRVLSRAWDLFRQNAGRLIGSHLFVFFLHTPQVAVEWVLPGQMGIKGLVAFATVILSYVTSIGLTCIVLQIVDGESFEFGDLFARPHLVFKYLLGSILYSVIVVAGLILLVIPAVIWGVRFSLWGFYVVEHEMGPVEALKASFWVTRSYGFTLAGLYGACLGLYLIGLIPLFLGWIIVWPVTSLAMVAIYRILERGASQAVPAGP